MTVGIVLVNYNGKKYLNPCVQSIKASSFQNFEIFVVDNASTDYSLEKLSAAYQDVYILREKQNLGFAGGCNIGIRMALAHGCESVLLLNIDTKIDADMIERMLQKSDDKTIVTCKMYYFTGRSKIWYAGGDLVWWKGTARHTGINQTDTGQWDRSRYVTFATGCCMLIHRNVFEKVGFLDEQYFMYLEDTDFCFRAGQAGVRIWYQADAILWHKVGGASGGAASPAELYYSTRNRLYYIRKCLCWKVVPLSLFLSTRVLRAVQMFRRSPSYLKIIVNAIRDYRLGKMGKQDTYEKV